MYIAPQPAPAFTAIFVGLTIAVICAVCAITPVGSAIGAPGAEEGAALGEGLLLGIGVDEICHTCVAVTLVLTDPVPVTSTFSPANGCGPLTIVLDVV